MDPPYNSRQYASNFHVLESICVYDKSNLYGKTGLREYSSQKSNFCIKSKVYKELKTLIENCDAQIIVMSYSTEGLLSKEEIVSVLELVGECTIYQKDYRRFKTNSLTKTDTGLKELLFICKVKK